MNVDCTFLATVNLGFLPRIVNSDLLPLLVMKSVGIQPSSARSLEPYIEPCYNSRESTIADRLPSSTTDPSESLETLVYNIRYDTILLLSTKFTPR